MRTFVIVLLSAAHALASSSSPSPSPFAQSVINYSAGTGATAGYDNPTAALGQPSLANPGMFGGPVDPFNPPYQSSQLVSIGAGGYLTLQFDSPILNNDANAFGIDLIVFGNNGFTIINGDFSGGGITDGTTFTFDPPGASRVLVSQDGVLFFELIAPNGLSASVDGLFPTDSQGAFHIPVDPSLTREDFAGLDLAGIRNRYAGSSGGTGFDLAWAQTAEGLPAHLADARFVRFEGIDGRIEIDALTIVPEPTALAFWVMGGFGLLAWQIKRRTFGR